MFKGLCLLTSLVLVTSLVLNIDLVSAANKEPHEYNLYFNDTSYQDSYVHSSKQGDFYFQYSSMFPLSSVLLQQDHQLLGVSVRFGSAKPSMQNEPETMDERH